MDTSREYELSSFLEYYAKVYQQNPNFQIHEDTFYEGLMRYDLPDDYAKPIDNNFVMWERRYKNSNLNVFQTPRQPGFLQFFNGKGVVDNGCHDFKLYISLPYNHVKEGVKRIFDFLDVNNIATHSKVSRKVRADAIVLRITREEDMLKVIEFVNKDRILSKNARRTNPFLGRHGIVGTAYDNMESYNSTVSKILANYFRYKRQTNTLNNVSLNDFQAFFEMLRNRVFTDHNAMQQFFNRQEYASYSRHDSKEEQILNYKQIFEMMSINISRDMTLREYVNLVRNYRDKRVENRELEEIRGIYQNVAAHNQAQEYGPTEKLNNNPEREKADLLTAKRILDSYLCLAFKKYEVSKVPKYLNYYLEGNIEGITREEQFRSTFENKMSPELVLELVNYDVQTYVANHYIQENRMKFSLFVNACYATMQKYDYEQLQTAVRYALKGDYKYITSGTDNNFRDNLRSLCTTTDIKNIIESLLMARGVSLESIDIGEVFAATIANDVNKSQKMSA